MKGTLYQGEMIVFVINDQLVLNKFKELVGSGELESYVNRVFAESVLNKTKESTNETLHDNDQIAEILQKLGGLEKKLDGSLIREVPPKSITLEAKSEVFNTSPVKSDTQEEKEVVEKPVKEKIKQATKKKGLNMSALMSKASQMKN